MEKPSGSLPPLPRHPRMSRASLPRIRGSTLHGPQRIRDHLVAAMRREPITWVGELSETDPGPEEPPGPPPWQPWAFLAIVFMITVGIAAIPVGAGIRPPDSPPSPVPTTKPPAPTTKTPKITVTPTITVKRLYNF